MLGILLTVSVMDKPQGSGPTFFMAMAPLSPLLEVWAGPNYQAMSVLLGEDSGSATLLLQGCYTAAV